MKGQPTDHGLRQETCTAGRITNGARQETEGIKKAIGLERGTSEAGELANVPCSDLTRRCSVSLAARISIYSPKRKEGIVLILFPSAWLGSEGYL